MPQIVALSAATRSTNCSSKRIETLSLPTYYLCIFLGQSLSVSVVVVAVVAACSCCGCYLPKNATPTQESTAGATI